jgi:hypothetical protein
MGFDPGWLKGNPGAGQPIASKVKPQLDILLPALGQYTQTEDSRTQQEALKTLVENLATNLAIGNHTDELPPELHFWVDGTVYDARGLGDRLKAGGFKRFGCFDITTSEPDEEEATGARAVFLAFREEPGVKETCIGHTLAIYPLYNGPLNPQISMLSMWNNVDWIKAVLRNRKYNFLCGPYHTLRVLESCR